MIMTSRYSQPHGEKSGAYDLVIRTSNSIASPKENVNLELYVSGYGHIENACIAVYPSWDIFEPEKSSISIGGGVASAMDPLGVIANFSNESFFDAKGPFQISTECKTPPPASKAPVSLDFRLGQKAPPGVHSVQLALKYFNGECWDTKTYTTNITIRNFYQRHETLVWAVGGIAACLGIVTDVYPAIRSILCGLL